MKKLRNFVAGLSFGLSMSFALAQQPSAPPPARESKAHPVQDCSKLTDPEKKARCEAKDRAMEKCKGLTPKEYRACFKVATRKKVD